MASRRSLRYTDGQPSAPVEMTAGGYLEVVELAQAIGEALADVLVDEGGEVAAGGG